MRKRGNYISILNIQTNDLLNFSTQKCSYLLLSLFITIIFIFLLLLLLQLLSILYNFYYCNYLPIFTLLSADPLALYILYFSVDSTFAFYFILCSSWTYYYHQFFNFPRLYSCISSMSPISVVTINCKSSGRIQINEVEWHSQSLPFNID